MEPIRGEVGLLSEGIWGGTGDARTGGGVGETPLEAVSTSFVSASFMDEWLPLTVASVSAGSDWASDALSSVALMATEREVMLLAMQEAMGDGGLGELAYPWRVDFELLRGRTFLLLLASTCQQHALVNLRLC